MGDAALASNGRVGENDLGGEGRSIVNRNLKHLPIGVDVIGPR